MGFNLSNQRTSLLAMLRCFNARGQRLIRIEYQLTNFEQLRAILTDKVLANKKRPTLPTSFSKRYLYHLFYAACVVGFSALGWYVGGSGKPLLGYVGMALLVAAIIYEYITTAYKVNIRQDKLEIIYPSTTKSICYNEITQSQFIRHLP